MIFLNQLRGVSARVMMPKTGAWTVDVDVDLDIVPVVPVGPAVLAIGPTVMRGTIDGRASGRFGTKAHVRLVAGGGGWDTPLPGMDLQSDIGVFSTAIYGTTAASVKETVVELLPPKLLGTNYSRMRGPASNVFAGVEWWMDLLGVTYVGPRPPLPAPPLLDILEWDPHEKVAIIASDVLIVPGMTIADPIRFGVAIVEEVEHTFDENGGRAIAWCSQPSLAAAATALVAAPPAGAGAKVVRALAQMARQAAGVSTLKKYRYRVVLQGPDGRLNLQSVDLLAECPLFLKLVDIWAGVAGVSMKLAPASVVVVSFIDNQPIVVGFDPLAPPALEVRFAALQVAIGLGRAHALLATPAMLTWITAVSAAINSLVAPGTVVPPPDAVSLTFSAD